MKSMILLAAVLVSIHARAADPLVTCTYKPTSSTIEHLPVNPNMTYIDVESPRSSFMLMGADPEQLLAQAQTLITQRKIQSGTLYAFERLNLGDTQMRALVSSIANGQVVDVEFKSLDFSNAPTPAHSGDSLVVQIATGVTCALH